MVAALAHRGPDGEGFFAENGVALGMRRLAVLDLSERGNQPMPTEDGAVQVVSNGEIYNFRDLRSRLVAEGHAFRSRSDTEVLAHGYEAFGGEGLVRRLEGMFAFALLDRRARKLWLARDGFGVKPLYLRRRPGQLAFASEIRVLGHDGTGPLRADPACVPSFLRVGFVPAPHTGFAGVAKLDPGTLLEVDLDRTDTKADLNYAPCKGQVVLVIRGEHGISFVRRGEGQGWSLPSDRIGPAEDVWKSTKRVARDQCGLMLRSAELAGIYDVVWHYTDVSVKRLHFVYAAMTDDIRCSPSKDKGISQAKFFKEMPRGVQEDEIQRFALADSSTK